MQKLTFSNAARDFLAGSDSPRDMLERCLDRIAARDGDVRAFAHLDQAGARVAADAATQRYRSGRPRSPIDGMPIGLKDIFETHDMPTTFGSPIFAGWCGGRDSAVAFALREAGAVIVGKLVSTEFAASVPGVTRNPRDLARTPGGSSSGSAAAVADGMLPVAIGSQVVGSILRPASFCGVIGLKPTFGALNRGGICDNFSQNAAGTLSNNLADAFAVCHEIAMRVGGDPGCVPFRGGPVAAPAARPQALAVIETDAWSDADAKAKQQFGDFVAHLAALGVRIIDRRSSARVERLEETIVGALTLSRTINGYESHWPLGELESRRSEGFSDFMRARIAEARAMTPDDYLALLARRDAMTRAFEALVGDIDGVITLSACGAAPLGLASTGDTRFNAAASAVRVPAISLPVFEIDGLPLGLQLIGFAHRERELSGIAQWLMDVAAMA